MHFAIHLPLTQPPGVELTTAQIYFGGRGEVEDGELQHKSLPVAQPFLCIIGTHLSGQTGENFAVSPFPTLRPVGICCLNLEWFFHLNFPLPPKFVF